jgi:hypothetical protein
MAAENEHRYESAINFILTVFGLQTTHLLLGGPFELPDHTRRARRRTLDVAGSNQIADEKDAVLMESSMSIVHRL